MLGLDTWGKDEQAVMQWRISDMISASFLLTTSEELREPADEFLSLATLKGLIQVLTMLRVLTLE